jgi:Zn-dependent peptidase ImmA (M78 family)
MPKKSVTKPYEQARELLKKLEINKAPVPVDKIAKSLGANLRFQPLDDELSGMVFIKDGIPIIGVNALHHPNRQRFTIAHEIGHLQLHREIISKTVHVDKEFPVLMRDQKASSGLDKFEVEANHFAAELLMPKFLIDAEIAGGLADIDADIPWDELARKFRVSRQALEYRIRSWF